MIDFIGEFRRFCLVCMQVPRSSAHVICPTRALPVSNALVARLQFQNSPCPCASSKVFPHNLLHCQVQQPLASLLSIKEKTTTNGNRTCILFKNQESNIPKLPQTSGKQTPMKVTLRLGSTSLSLVNTIHNGGLKTSRFEDRGWAAISFLMALM